MIPWGPKAASLRKKTFQRLWNKTSLIVSGEETIFTEGWASGVVWGEQSHAFPKSDFISFHTHEQKMRHNSFNIIIMHFILIWRKNVAAKIPIKSNGEKFCVWHSATLSAGNCWSWLQKFLIEQRLASSPSPALWSSPLSFPLISIFIFMNNHNDHHPSQTQIWHWFKKEKLFSSLSDERFST